MQIANERLSSFTSISDHDLNLDNLPELVFDCLFQYLHLEDIFRLKMVSKKFYSTVVKSYQIRELSLMDKDQFECDYKTNWFSTTKSTKLRCLMELSKLNILSNLQDNLLNLRKLRIRGTFFKMPSIRLEILNKLAKLEILDLHRVILISNGQSLQLLNLKALSIYIWLNESVKMLIDTPNLRNLDVNNTNFDLIKFKNPMSIQHFRCFGYNKEILEFINLQYLELGTCRDLNSVNLSKLNKLIAIKFIASYYSYGIEEINELKNLFRSNKNLELVLDGVKIKEINKFDEYYQEKCSLRFQLKNYKDLEENLHYVNYIDYNMFINLLPKKHPSDLFTKLNNIKCLSINGKVDETQLLNFIEKFPNLFRLNVYSLQLVKSEFLRQYFNVNFLSDHYIFLIKTLANIFLYNK